MAEGPRGLPDGHRRVVGVTDQDLLGGEHHLDGVAEAVYVETSDTRRLVVGGPEEGQQVQAGQIAGRVIQVDILGARVAGRDPAGVGRGVPAVDGGIELDAGIGALPRRLGHLPEEAAGPYRFDDRAVGNCPEIPVAVGLDGPHELVGDPDRVVGVLVHDGVAVGAVEADVETGLGQYPHLALLTGLAPDEVPDVGMVGVEDHHLGRPSGLASALNGAGRRVGTPHEAHRPAGLPAAPQHLPARPDCAQVDARTGTALEDGPLLDVPVKDG